MSLVIKDVLDQHQISQGELANAIGISRSAVNQVVNNGIWPKQAEGLKDRMQKYLQGRGIRATGLFKKVAPKRANASGPVLSPNRKSKENVAMLRKVAVNHKARQHFSLSRDPFVEPSEPADIYLNQASRYVSVVMMEKTRHGGFLAVVGESGSGKTTLREEFEDRLLREQKPIIVIKPYVVGMEENESRGKPMRVAHIAEAIMQAIAPTEPMKSSPQARLKQLHDSLTDSARLNNRHLLIIEEAHALPDATLKHLKRVLELKDGLRPLISVILIGQLELATRLSPNNNNLKEVSQRIEIISLPPIDNDIEAFLKHRLQRAGSSLDRVADRGALDALRTRLMAPVGRADSSWAYPLAVQNLLAAAMNAAAELGAPIVTGEIIKDVVR